MLETVDLTEGLAMPNADDVAAVPGSDKAEGDDFVIDDVLIDELLARQQGDISDASAETPAIATLDEALTDVAAELQTDEEELALPELAYTEPATTAGRLRITCRKPCSRRSARRRCRPATARRRRDHPQR